MAHHVGLLVSDIEEAVRFYVDALDGRRLTRPVLVEGDAARMVMDGPAGTRFRFCLVAVAGSAVELFCFEGPDRPAWADDPERGRVPHLGVHVADVPAALERIERAGGRRLWDPSRWGRARVVYAADPDGNVIELLDAGVEAIAAEAIRMFPEAAL